MCNNDCCTNHTCHAIMIFSILALLLWPNAPNLNIFESKNPSKSQNNSIKGGHRNNTSPCITNPNKTTTVMAFSYGALFTLILIFAFNNLISSPKDTIERPTSTPRWPTTTTIMGSYYDTGPADQDAGASAGGGGIGNDLLRTFPTFAYRASRPPPRMGKGTSVCAICQSKFRDDQMLRLLPYCDHLFHLDCIDEWLTCHSTCPCCRDDL
ncbi:hypothetical protein RND81_09G225200 [Saponaria officinalis]|uniref:RING-type E3 ubiquitin transferase n=1 Tax=Saponaria officinalis TaxID=3572 RepID=A0AAW1IRS7_SAPOF